MFIEVETTSTIPIYTQLINQIKKAIVKRELTEGDYLPSVRILASDLSVNMHTVNKAYNLLTDEGILLKSNKGYTISPIENREATPELASEIQARLEEILVDAFVHECSEELITEWIAKISGKLRKGEE